MGEKKTVIITGTSRGIGYELVSLFSNANYNILALSRNTSPITKLDLKNVSVIPFDLNDSTGYLKVKNFISKNWQNVDILINNAGAIINKPFSQTNYEDFKTLYGTNVFGLAELTRHVIPFMPEDGHVVNISSMGGVQGSMKFSGLSAYSSSKGALITLTELLAEEYKNSGPSFNVLALGAVQTEMLDEVFPGYNAPNTAAEMASHIFQFSISGHKFYNGKLIQISKSTP